MKAVTKPHSVAQPLVKKLLQDLLLAQECECGGAQAQGHGRREGMQGPYTGGQKPDKSLTTHMADALASVVVAKATAEPSETPCTGAERPDCSVVASRTGSAGGRGPAEVPWASGS